MRMIFKDKIEDDQSEMYVNVFKQNESFKNVKFEKETNSIYVEGDSKMIAIADELTKNEWKFINYDKNQHKILSKILSENILKELGL